MKYIENKILEAYLNTLPSRRGEQEKQLEEKVHLPYISVIMREEAEKVLHAVNPKQALFKMINDQRESAELESEQKKVIIPMLRHLREELNPL